MLVVPRIGRSSFRALFQHPIRPSIAHVVLENLPLDHIDYLELVRQIDDNGLLNLDDFKQKYE